MNIEEFYKKEITEDEIAEIVWDEIQYALSKDHWINNEQADEIEQILARQKIDNNIARAIMNKIEEYKRG